jgi:hypothetical protein
MANRFDYRIYTEVVDGGLAVYLPDHWVGDGKLLVPTMAGLLELIMELKAAADRLKVQLSNG